MVKDYLKPLLWYLIFLVCIKDVDECKNASIANFCSAGCINTLGSYYCNEQSIIHEECSVGFKRLDNGTCVGNLINNILTAIEIFSIN